MHKQNLRVQVEKSKNQSKTFDDSEEIKILNSGHYNYFTLH